MAKSEIVTTLEEINKSIDSASNALDDLNQKALEGGLGFDVLLKSLNTSITAVSNLTTSLGELGTGLGLDLKTGILAKSMGGLADAFESVMGGALAIAGMLDGVGQAIDSVTGFSRKLNLSLYDSVSQFNGSFTAAKQFSDYIIKSAQDYATAEFGFISPADRIAAVKGLAQAGVPLAHMSDIVESAAGKMDLLNTAFLHSKALGMDTAKYAEMIGHAMITQGLSTQEAAEQMAMFGDVSNNTGLRVDKVAGSMQRLAGNFAKLGLTADFGQPILEGFADSLKGMGLGFENAIELSETLSGALVKLSSNYAAAYVTFQRGGLDMGGGGGALGAGIGMRARMLESGGDQGDMAVEMAGALRDTLESFTGGQIITVQEAAQDPALQATFYTQTKLLEDLYGIQDPAAQDRTLELLTQLEDATRSGNTDLAESLAADLKEATGAQDATLGYQEKTAKFTEATFAELQFMNKNMIEGFRISGDSLAGVVTDFQGSAIETIRPKLEDLNAGGPEAFTVDFQKSFRSLGGSINSQMDSLDAKISSLDTSGDIRRAFEGFTMSVSDPNGAKATDSIAKAINGLVDYFKGSPNSRVPKGG